MCVNCTFLLFTVRCWSTGLNATVCFGNKLNGYLSSSPCWECAAVASLLKSCMQMVQRAASSSSEWYDLRSSLADPFSHSVVTTTVTTCHTCCHHLLIQPCCCFPSHTAVHTFPKVTFSCFADQQCGPKAIKIRYLKWQYCTSTFAGKSSRWRLPSSIKNAI